MDGGLFVGCGDEDRVATHLAEMTAADCLVGREPKQLISSTSQL